MNDGNPLPTMHEFAKTLAVVLLSEAGICLAMSAACRMQSEGRGTNATGLMLLFYLAVGMAILSNLVTVVMAAKFMNEDIAERAHARVSFFATSGQTTLVAALCFFTGPAIAAMAAVTAFLALVIVLVFVPGKFPPDFMLR
jgi:hypothetical protein